MDNGHSYAAQRVLGDVFHGYVSETEAPSHGKTISVPGIGSANAGHTRSAGMAY